MSFFIYKLAIYLYVSGIKIASLWNAKARLWVNGRRTFPTINKNTANKDKTIWMHCSSLGEFEQGRPLLEQLKKEQPDAEIVLTFFSPSGYEVCKNYAGADYVFYLPIDSATNAKKFIDTIEPTLVLWIKYEYWYFYLTELKKRNIPTLLISAIFLPYQPFFKWYGGIWKKMLGCFSHLFVQTPASKDALNKISFVGNITVSGDTRFDRVITIANNFEPIELIEKFCGDNRVIVAGSTWEEDEAELIHFVRANPNIKFIVAPHSIDAENLKDVKKEFKGSIYFSELTEANLHSTNIVIIDNVGMLSRLYKYATITYVGGAFTDNGVHNVLEAAVYGKPVIYGPEYEKYAEATELVYSGGGISINNALEFETVLKRLLENDEELSRVSNIAKNYVYVRAGASQKIVDHIYENRLLTN
ncbi:3-deoxy-D-manno-octulosonic acid transferase [Ferruginibacter sp. SUN002]|uniref:3-deoxy-D-manno-octulosonic acid transferase n=1 Tax=Ferruginibacter sp. SUN002 TaxID=2937789 RepID=UPI003D36EDF3